MFDGDPVIDPQGTHVGPYRTMVEAISISTIDPSGDSEVHLLSKGLLRSVTFEPKCILPKSLAARLFGEMVHTALDGQLKNTLLTDFDGRFLQRLPEYDEGSVAGRDAVLFAKLTFDMKLMHAVITSRREM